MAVKWNNTVYYYVTNLQGDVTAILNSAGKAVVTYTYDAWGKILSTTGDLADSLGAFNPLRYRSYVFDPESGLYYLQSRYYNPERGRFINADNYTATGQGFIGYNTFAYCNNNPTGLTDYGGDIPVAVGIGALIAVGAAGAVAMHQASKSGAELLADVISDITVPSAKDLKGHAIRYATKKIIDSYEYQQAIAKAATKVKNKTPHIHHIVPVGKFSNRSQSTVNKISEMHEKLNSVGINRYIDPMNVMLVSPKTHARLHTDAYIDHVHSYIMSAGDSKQEVYQAMFYLRIEIAAQDMYASGF